jgi:hypothetical protein
VSNPGPNLSPASVPTPPRSESPLSRQFSEGRSPSPALSERSMPLPIDTGAARPNALASNPSIPSLILPSPQLRPRRNSMDAPSRATPTLPLDGVVKSLCNRGSSTLSVHLAEPVLYLTGFEPSEYENRSPAILRGSLVLKLLKPSKIKTITLVFRGRARTEWLEGIPPKKAEFYEEKELMTHTWPFFNAQFTGSETSNGADFTRLLEGQRLSMDLSRVSVDSASSFVLSDASSVRSTPAGSPNLSVFGSTLSPNNLKVGIPFGQSQSYSKEEKTQTQLRGYKLFAPGEYM